jgi:hypothetical protein
MVLPGMVLHAAGKWEHEGTSTATGTISYCPTVAVEDDMTVPLMVCQPSDNSLEHPRNDF